MDEFDNSLDSNPDLEPMETFKIVGLDIVYSAPVIGLILAIVLACTEKNVHVKNHAKAAIIMHIIGM